MKNIRNVLIVGGGVAGLTLACGIARHGIHTLVVEAKNEVSGSGIGFWGYAVRAFDLVGLRDAVVNAGAIAQHIELCDEAGNVRIAYDNPVAPDADYPPELVIARPQLAEVLTENAIARGAEIRYGTTLEEYAETDNGAHVRLSDGTEATWDLVVAADGAYSTMRERIFGIAQRPELTGTGVWRAIVRQNELMSLPRAYYGERNHLFLYPCGGGNVYAGISEWVLQPKRDEEEGRTHLLEILEPFSAPAVVHLRGLIERRQISPKYRPISWLLLQPPWYRRRAVMIGDAAHAASPNLSSGGGMGVEDAGVLAELIGRNVPLDKLLEEFMTRRWPRVSRVYRDSRTIHDRPREPQHWNGASPLVLAALDYLSEAP